MAGFHVLFRPPFEQGREALVGRADRPIKLRGEVIDPAFLKPSSRIGVEIGVGIEPFDRRRKSWTPNSERADAEFHKTLLGLDRGIGALHEAIDVFAAPIVAAEVAAATPIS